MATPSRAKPTNASAPLLMAVYGTLRKGEANFRRLRLGRSVRFIGPCAIQGRLYDLGAYPGLVAGDGLVRGELIECRNPLVLRRLDVFEGFDPGDRAGSLFVRRLVRLAEPDADAWVYFYARPGPAGGYIASGDWVAYRTGRRRRRALRKPPRP